MHRGAGSRFGLLRAPPAAGAWPRASGLGPVSSAGLHSPRESRPRVHSAVSAAQAAPPGSRAAPRCGRASGQCGHRPLFSPIVKTVVVTHSDPGRGPCPHSELSETLQPLQQQNLGRTTGGDAADPHWPHAGPSSPSGMSSFRVAVHILVNFHRVKW